MKGANTSTPTQAAARAGEHTTSNANARAIVEANNRSKSAHLIPRDIHPRYVNQRSNDIRTNNVSQPECETRAVSASCLPDDNLSACASRNMCDNQ